MHFYLLQISQNKASAEELTLLQQCYSCNHSVGWYYESVCT